MATGGSEVDVTMEVDNGVRHQQMVDPIELGWQRCEPLDVYRLAQASQRTELSHLQGNSEVTIDAVATDYVLNDAQDDVIEMLDERGLVILSGPPGCGKSFQGKAILRHYRNEGYTPYTLSTFREWHSHVGKGKRSVVLMDGTLGRRRVNKTEYEIWLVMRGTVEALIATGNCKLVLTMYPHVLHELRQLEGSTDSQLGNPAVAVDLSGGLDREVKEQLLFKHLKNVGLPEDKKREVVGKVLKKDITGPVFAWCCKWMVRHWHSVQDPTVIFTRPAEAYFPLLKHLVMDKTHGETIAVILALAMRGLGGFLHDPRRVQPHLKELRFHDYSEYRLDEHADLLKGSILAHDGCGFISRVLYEAAGLVLGRAYSVPVLLKVCDARFMVDYIRMDPQAELAVFVDNKPSVRQLLNEKLKALMVKKVPGTFTYTLELQDTVLEAVLESLLFDDLESDERSRTKMFLKEITASGFQWKYERKLTLTLSSKRKCVYPELQDSGPRLKFQKLNYLDDQSRPIPDSLLSVQATEDAITVQIQGQRLSLVLRLFADTQPDEKDDNGNTLLHLAVSAGEWNVITMAVSSRESFSVTNNENTTPGDLLAMRWKGQKVSYNLSNLINRLEEAFRARDTETVVRAIFDNSDINLDILLRFAVDAKQTEMAAFLIRLGAQVESVHMGQTVLFRASELGDTTTVLLLIQQGADVNTKNNESFAALHVASQYGFTETARALIQHGADVYLQDDDGDTPLHLASSNGKIDTVLMLIQRCVDVSTKNNKGLTALHVACQKGTTDTARALIQHGADMNLQTNNGDTPLHCAIYSGIPDTVLMLIQQGVDINTKNNKDLTPLNLACQKGTTETARVLIQHGADLNLQNDDGNTPFHLASYNDKTDTVLMLIGLGVDVNINNKNGATALHMACQKGFKETARALIQHGADLNLQDDNGDTSLLWASYYGNTDTVLMLIQQGVDVNTKDNKGFAALHVTCQLGFSETARALIQHGADLNLQDDNGDTPLLWASYYGNTETVLMLIQQGVDVNTKDNKGFAALHVTCQLGFSETTRALIQHGADLNLPGDHGDTPLHRASIYDKTHIVLMLIQQGAEVNTKTNKGFTSLHLACQKGFAETARALIHHDADVNLQDDDGDTPLHRASYFGKTDTVLILIEQGAIVNIKNKKGLTALGVAHELGFTETVQALIQHGADDECSE